MSKKEAKKTLIKDIAIALIAWVIGGTVICLSSGGFGSGGLIAGFLFAGIPFGWKWLSNIVIATSILMIIIKGIASIFVGWFAVVIILIKDVIVLVTAKDDVVRVTDEDSKD